MACSNDCCTLEELVKCPNYLLCNSYDTQDVLDDNNGLCVYCCVMNGKLKFKDDIKCIICLGDNKIGVCFDKECDHHICTYCYRKKYLVDNGDDNKNIFNECSICSQTLNQDSLPK
jgi:hypothetical protein